MQIDICMLNLLNSLANSYRLSGDPFGFSTSIIMLSTNNDSYFFLSNSHTICSNWISSILLNKKGDSGHLNLVPDLMVQTSKILPLIVKYTGKVW